MNNKKQSGFSILAIIVAVLVSAGIGYAGYRLYSHFNKQASNTTGSTQTETTSTQPVATYLGIKQLGIKIKLDDSIKDAVYSYNAPDVTAPSTSSASISTKSLTAASSACAVTAGGALGTIIKTSDPNVTGVTLVNLPK